MRIPELSAPPLDLEEHRFQRDKKFYMSQLNLLVTAVAEEHSDRSFDEQKLAQTLTLPTDEGEKDIPAWIILQDGKVVDYVLYVTQTGKLVSWNPGEEVQYIDTDAIGRAEFMAINEALTVELEYLVKLAEADKLNRE